MRLSLASFLLAASTLPAQVSSNIELLAHIPNAPCTTTDVWEIGDYILVARTLQGFSVVDVSDPANPVMSTIQPPGYPASPGTLGCPDIKADDRYIYVADQAAGEGVFIYDSQPDPMNPTLVGTLRNGGAMPRNVHNLWVEGDYLYAQSEIWNISDRTNPQFVTDFPHPGDHPSGTTHDVIVIDDRAYLSRWTDGIEIWDVSNPAVPILLAWHTYEDARTHNMWPTKDHKYLYTTDESLIDGVGGWVRIWDIQNLGNITEVGAYKVGPTSSVVHNVHVRGDLLYVAYYKEGIRVCSIKDDPTNPVEIAYYDTYPALGDGCHHFFAGVWGVYPYRDDVMVIGDLDTGIYVMRVDPITHNLGARYRPARGRFHASYGAIELDFTFQNDAPADLDAFGVLTLSSVNGQPVFLPLASAVSLLTPAQSINRKVQIPVPARLEAGFTLGFTGYSGIASPIVLSEQKQVSVTIE